MAAAILAARSVLTFAPAAGLVGLALYQAATLHDMTASGQSLLQAAGLAGLGSYLHVAQASQELTPRKGRPTTTPTS